MESVGYPVLRRVAYGLAHAPDLVRFGSKPRREIAKQPDVLDRLQSASRTYLEACVYPPNRTFIGELTPHELAKIDRPWFKVRDSRPATPPDSTPDRFGEILTQEELYMLLAQADVLEPPLFRLSEDTAAVFTRQVANATMQPLLAKAEFSAAPDVSDSKTALPIMSGGRVLGRFERETRAGGGEDENLSAHHLLENLCAKATGAQALATLLRDERLEPQAIDFIISCGEEAVGDRYQRGGGGMAKAIGEMCGCVNASGIDIKNFCAAPASALVTAGALVMSGLRERIAVVGGGALAKLGMKFQAFLENGIPILDDCLASMACLVTRDDGESPILRLEPGAVGLTPIGASTSDEKVYRQFVLEPLEALGLTMLDVDRFAPELHNPEIMQWAGSGDVAQKNYRSIAALGVLTGAIQRDEMAEFVDRIGMVGFAPTQGHIPSGVSYLGHAAAAIRRDEIRRVMFLAKASLFLGRCTELFDGVSFVLEANPRAST